MLKLVWRRVSNNSPPWPGPSSYLDIRKEGGGVDSSAQGAQPFFAPDMRGPQLGDVRLSCCTTHLCTCTMCTLPFIKFHRAPPLHRTAHAHAHPHRLPRPGSRDMSPIDSSVRSSCAFWKNACAPVVRVETAPSRDDQPASVSAAACISTSEQCASVRHRPSCSLISLNSKMSNSKLAKRDPDRAAEAHSS